MEIQDETGTTWLVKPGDRASKLVGRLKTLGFQWIVLPASALVAGVVPVSAPVPDDLVRRVRLNDCLGALRDSDK